MTRYEVKTTEQVCQHKLPEELRGYVVLDTASPVKLSYGPWRTIQQAQYAQAKLAYVGKM